MNISQWNSSHLSLVGRSRALFLLFALLFAPSAWSATAMCELLLARTSKAEINLMKRNLSEGEWQELPAFSIIDHQMNRDMMDHIQDRPEGGHLFVTGEVAVLKELNDSYYQDKDLVTRLVDFHKDLFIDEMLSGNYPLIAEHLDLAYSDFKTLRFAFSFDSAELRSELQEVLLATNQAFTRNLEKAGLVDHAGAHRGLVRFPELWFLLGVGKTADQAGYAARTARRFSSPEELSIRSYEEVEPELESLLAELEAVRAAIESRISLIAPAMLQAVPGTNKKSLNRFVIKALLKTKSSKKETEGLTDEQLVQVREEIYQDYLNLVRLRLEQAYRLPSGTLKKEDIDLLKVYISGLDRIAPGIFVEERVILDFNKAPDAIVSIDFTGLNVWNFEQTAFALVRSQGQSPAQVLEEVRIGEIIATQRLDEHKQFIGRVFLDVLGVRSEFSGDDGAAYPEKLTWEQKEELVTQLADSGSADAYRLTFVDKKIGNVEAELIEKDLRVELESYLTLEEQSRLTLAIDMSEYRESGIISIFPGGVDPGSSMESVINEAFRSVLKKRGYGDDVVESSYVDKMTSIQAMTMRVAP